MFNLLEKPYQWYGRRNVRIVLGVIAVLVLYIIFFNGGNNEEITEENEERGTLVTLATPLELLGEQNTTIVGTVTANTEANLLSERGGRVVSTGTSLGSTVRAGQIIATLENSAERAALLSAQGSYEAALAGAAQSGVGIREAEAGVQTAESAAITNFRNAYGTFSSTIYNQIDPLFANPTGPNPTIRFSGGSQTQSIIADRVATEPNIKRWQDRNNTVNNTNVISYLNDAKADISRLIGMLDKMINAMSANANNQPQGEAGAQNIRTELNASRSTLVSLSNSIDNSISGINSAKDGLERARLAGSSNQPSLAQAQVKQALGGLQSAQSNLAKTIIRTPISGTVATLSVKTGDFVNAYQPVAIVTNASGYEIVAFVGDADAELVRVGEEVFINDDMTGVVTNFSPTINPDTRKREMRIAVPETSLTAGDTVRIALNRENLISSESNDVYIPINAVRFSGDNAYVFVVEDNKLVRRDIEVANVSGGLIKVASGIDNNTAIVSDARGKQVDMTVRIAE